MDYIIRKLNEKLELEESGSYEYILYLRERVEYCLLLLLGYFWNNMHLSDISLDDKNNVMSNIGKMTFGHVAEAIRILDYRHEITSAPGWKGTKKWKGLNDYPGIRNEHLGHGYSISDSVASELIPIYDMLMKNIPFFQKEMDFIIVEKSNDRDYLGVRIFSKNGSKQKWSCPKEVFECCVSDFPRTYLILDNKYVPVSPFIHLEKHGDAVYVFCSLEDRRCGKIKLNLLFGESKENNVSRIFPKFKLSSDGDNCIISANGTVMNKFSKNFEEYFSVGIEKTVLDFVKKNNSSVAATIWGHGGVGKTACTQNVCDMLFSDVKQSFSHIVFITAKDRFFNPQRGNIEPSFGNVQKYSEVIEIISKTLFGEYTLSDEKSDDLEINEEKIRNFGEHVLIVIDDYETFIDEEKEKIVSFIKSLHINHHKVLVTTRNRKFVIGEEIATNEFDLPKTKEFLNNIVKTRYPDYSSDIENLIIDSQVMEKIHESTAGRPIFIYQFVYLYVQHKYNENLVLGLCSSSNAKEFLYGRIYDYLSENAKQIFATLPILIDDELRFRIDILEASLHNLLSKEKIDLGLRELQDLRVIEPLGDYMFRIYSLELKDMMEERYNNFPEEFCESIKSSLSRFGGKDIQGTVMEGFLSEADKCRYYGNERETITRYRQLLNMPSCPYNIRKTALKNVVSYLAVSRLDLPAAIAIIEEYLAGFSDDAEISHMYVYHLWASKNDVDCDFCDRTKANEFIRRYFYDNKHDKLSLENIAFFALGAGYCIDYALNIQSYSTDALKRNELVNTFNLFSKPIFTYVTTHPLGKEEAKTKHNIRVALVQTLNLCLELGNIDSGYNYIKTGLDICSYLRNSSTPVTYYSKVNRSYHSLINLLNKRYPGRRWVEQILPPEVSTDNLWWEELDKYSEGDVVDVIITEIRNYGVMVAFGVHLYGLIHISNLTNHFITNISDEFKIGQKYRARIVSINRNVKRISLSLKDV